MEQSNFCQYCYTSDGDHEICIAIMNNKIPNISSIGARLSLPYFKQGDDLYNSTVENTDGSVDLVKSLNAHADTLESAVHQLRNAANVIKSLKNEYPNIDKELDLHADTHVISFHGPINLIQELVKRQALSLEYYDDLDHLYLENEDEAEEYEDDEDIDINF